MNWILKTSAATCFGLIGSLTCEAQSLPGDLQAIFNEIERIESEIREAEARNRIPLTNDNKVRPTRELFRHDSPIRTLLRTQRVTEFRFTDNEVHSPDAEENWRAGLQDSLWAFHQDGTFSVAFCRKNLQGEEFNIMRGRYEVAGNTYHFRMFDRSDIGASTSTRELVGSLRFEQGQALCELNFSRGDSAAWHIKYSQGGYNYQNSLTARLVLTAER